MGKPAKDYRDRGVRGQFLPVLPNSVLRKIECDNFRVLDLPFGLEASIASIFKRLPEKRHV